MKKILAILLAGLTAVSTLAVTAAAEDTTVVTDGLAAYYDAVNNVGDGHDSTTETWKDVSGNSIDFEVDLDDTNYWTDNAYHVNSAYCFFDDSLVDVVNGDQFSVEITIGEFTGLGTSFNTLLNSTNDNFSLFIRTAGDYIEFKNAGNSRPKVAGGTDFVTNSTITITYDVEEAECNLYVDGELIDQQFPTSNIGADTFFLGHPEDSRNWEGDVYSIRYYTIALTADQVAQNVAADQAKYFTASATTTEEVATTEETATEATEEVATETTETTETVETTETEVTETVETEETVETAETVETTETVETEEAPQTFDFGVIAALTAIVSAAGYAVTKKSR